MRTATKATVGLVSLGILAGSYQFGATGETAVSLSASAPDTNSATPQSMPQTQPTAENISTNTANESTPSQTQTATASAATKTQSSATAQAVAPEPTATATKSAATGGTQTGDPIRYKYGTIQLEVVKSGNSIESINLIQASTKGREWASAPGELVQLALSAQGTNFGNLSGATYTTEAFRAALDSALAKF